jgi:hypothetical protein
MTTHRGILRGGPGNDDRLSAKIGVDANRSLRAALALMPRNRGGRVSIPFLACMATAAAFYHLPPRVLPSIQAVEGGRVGLAHLNANNTADLGVMQVNTIWIQPLANFAHMPPEAVAARLVNDPCFNIAAAAAIMRVYMNEARDNLMIAIGHYHSHTPSLSFAYQQKVLSAAGTLFRSNRTLAPAPVSQP